MNMRFSIITPVYNGEKTIARTIESVLNQTYLPYEYYIIDGASTDRTVQIANEYNEAFRKEGIIFSIVSEKDNGIYDAINKGIKLCSGDFVGIINSDDWYEHTAIDVICKLHEKEHYDMAYASIRMHNGNHTFIKKASNPRIVSSRTWNHPTQFTSMNIYKEKLYRNESVFDDLDMLLWIHKNGYRISVSSEILANFTMGGCSNNMKQLKEVINNIKIKYSIYKRNGFSGLYVLDIICIEFAKKILGRV